MAGKKEKTSEEKTEERKAEGLASIAEREKEINRRKAAGQTEAGARRDVGRGIAAQESAEVHQPIIDKEEAKQSSADITSQQEERRLEREGAPPKEIAPETQEPVSEEPVSEGALGEEDDKVFGSIEEGVASGRDSFRYLNNQGEVETQYSGGVTPLTASDLTDVVLLFSGLGLVKFGGKQTAKVLSKTALKKGGLIGENVAKSTMLNTIKNKAIKVISKSRSLAAGVGIGAAVGVAGQLIAPFAGQKITAPDRQIRSIDQDFSQIRETITLPLQLVSSGVPSSEGLDMIDSMRVDVNAGVSNIKLLSLGSQEMKTNPDFTAPMLRRANKLLLFLDLAERQILEINEAGRTPTTEELASLMTNWEALLNE